MNNNPLNNIVRSARNRRILKRTLSMLCVVVLLFTMHTLRRDANTLERIPMCGYTEEHIHTLDCYDGDVLVCGKHEHTHTDACYQESPEIDLGACDLDIQGDTVVDPTLMDNDLELSLGDVDLTLDMPDVNPGVASNASADQVRSGFPMSSLSCLPPGLPNRSPPPPARMTAAVFGFLSTLPSRPTSSSM